MGVYVRNTTTSSNPNMVDHSHALNQLLHDIRSPISALGACVYRLEQGPSDAAVDLLKQTFDRLKGMTAPKKGLASVNITEVINNAIAEKKSLVSGSVKIGFFEAAAPDKAVFAIADRAQLSVIVSNLLNNSIEAQASEIMIQLTSSGSRVQVLISDNGVGFDQKILNFIGLPGISSVEKQNGSGLGLSNAIKLLKSWGGSLEIQSQINTGAALVIELQKA